MRIEQLILKGVGPFEDLNMGFPPGDRTDRADVHLLVGPNGTGKSTVLWSIAQCFHRRDTGGIGRAHGQGSYIVVSDPHASLWAAAPSPDQSLFVRELGLLERRMAGEGFGLFGRDDDPRLLGALTGGAHPTAGAIFAYGGLRTGEGATVTAIEDQQESPLVDAVAPRKHRGIGAFEQWIVNALAQRALSAERGDHQGARDRSGALDGVRDGVRTVTGWGLDFHLDTSPRFRLAIRVDGGPPLDLRQLPDGLQSLLAWLGDLLMRLDRIAWTEPGPVTERPFVLLLDEVEVHLHPAWQRRVLPMAERMFPKAQIICSTHSPFVISSATDAWIHAFRLDGGRAVVDPPQRSALGTSYAAVMDSILGVREEFDVDSEDHLNRFRALRDRRLAGDPVDAELEQEAALLRRRSDELATIVETELRNLRRRLASVASA